MNNKTAFRFLSLIILSSLISSLLFGSTPALLSRAAPITPGESFLTGPNQGDPLEIALRYLRSNLLHLGISSLDFSDFIVTDRYVSDHTGVTHIYLRQRYQGIEVFQANININIARDGAVINQGGSFVSKMSSAANSPAPARTAVQSIESAADHLGVKLTASPRLLRAEDSPAQESVYAAESIASDPIRARLVYHIVDSSHLRLAWSLEINENSGEHWWNLLVDAQNGEVLTKYDYVVHDDWGVPTVAYDNDLTTVNRVSSLSTVAAAATTLNAPAVAASYNVFALPKESPLDGPRTLEFPEDATASPFGWHDTNGVAGAEYTYTRGNNAYAYTDLDANNTPDGGSSPDGGAGLVFNSPLDLNLGPDTYRPFAVTNLFYWNNIVHDVLYSYGFTELAGNFQSNNYGNGGLGGDPVSAEAQDGSGTDNANFGTPADGAAPRMQMFVWTPPTLVTLTVNSPAGIAGNYYATGAIFGPASFNITGDTIVVVDNAAPTSDGCTAIQNDLTGKIALIDRGTCSFVIKVKNAQNMGAIGVIMLNNAPGAPITMGGTDATITIPSVMVSDVDGALFKANLPNVHIQSALASSVTRDSDLDAGVIAHEYGHGISNRLTGGPANVFCLTNQEQMGEGWSDFLALVLTTDPADIATTPRGVGAYLEFQPATGNGIRPTPYTTNLAVNPSTYSNISFQAVPHGVGYVWASMLWEVYWNMVDLYGYNPDVYDAWNTGGNNLAIQLVIDGMKLQPCSPGFVDGRNAILTADQILTGGANYCSIYAAFTKRGLGFSATQGNTNSVLDGSQAFDMPVACAADIVIKPPSNLTAVQIPDMVRQELLSFQNLGSDLLWTISEAPVDCNTPSDLPWVSLVTPNGTTMPGITTVLPVTFNSTGLLSGTSNTGLLCITSNDPTEPVVSIPLTLQVDFPLYLPGILR